MDGVTQCQGFVRNQRRKDLEVSGMCEAPPQPAARGRAGGLSALTRGRTLWDAQGGALGRLDGTHGQRVLTPPPRCKLGRALGAPEGAPGEGDRAQGCPGCCAHTGRGPRCVPCGVRAPSVERPVADSCRPPPSGRRTSGRPTPSSPCSPAWPPSSTASTSARRTRGRYVPGRVAGPCCGPARGAGSDPRQHRPCQLRLRPPLW